MGINRVTWNLRFSGDGEFGQGGGGPPGVGFRMLAPPGEYQVTLRVNGGEHSFTLLKNPSSSGSEATIAEQVAMLVELDADIAASRAMTERIDTVRTQLDTLMDQLGTDPSEAELRAQALALNLDFTGLADSLVQQKPGGFLLGP